MSASEITLYDGNGIERFRGTQSPAGGGGSQPKWQQVSGAPVSIADGASADLTWDTDAGPDNLLDLSAPALPTALTAGIYAVTITAALAGENLTVDGQFHAVFDMDVNGQTNETAQTSPAATAALASPVVSMTQVWHLPAGGVIEVVLYNFDGAAPHNFDLEATIVKLF